MNSRSLATAIALALPLTFGMARPTSAHETGESHGDGNVYHDRSYGRHVDHEYRPDGEHIDHDYSGGRHIDYYRPRWSYDTGHGRDSYDYDRPFYHTHRQYYDPDNGYYGRRYSRYDDDDDDYYDRNRSDRRPYGGGYYGDYPPAPRSYDPYYGGGGGGSFDWKQDWPLLLGTMINTQIGR